MEQRISPALEKAIHDRVGILDRTIEEMAALKEHVEKIMRQRNKEN